MLYVADTVSARLYAFDIEAPGVLAKSGSSWAHSGRVVGGAPPGPAGFDSLAVLANGNIAVATLSTGKITEFSPQGAIVREVAVPDIYPTVLDLLGLPYPQATWAVDGESILGLLRAGGGGNWTRSKSLKWRLEGQVALLDAAGRYKLVRNADKGQCALQPSSYSGNLTGAFLFDLRECARSDAPSFAILLRSDRHSLPLSCARCQSRTRRRARR